MKLSFLNISLLSGFLLFAGCENPYGSNDSEDSDPAAALRGEWVITSQEPEVGEHHLLVFRADDRYEIRDSAGVTFESGPMTNVTASGFECVIEQADQLPMIVGSENYAEYSIEGAALEISFYNDVAKDTRYVTFQAER